MLQEISLKKKVREEKKKREKRKTRGDQASSSEAHCFYFQKGLLYLYLYTDVMFGLTLYDFASFISLYVQVKV